MFTKFLKLEWKAFFRSSSFTGKMIMKIFMVIVAIYFSLLFLGLGVLLYKGISDAGQDPLVVVSKYMVYYMLGDIIMRLFLQKIPVINIRPLLSLPIKRKTIVNFALGKTMLSYFNTVHALFFVPFSFILIKEGYDPLNVLFWFTGMMALIYCNNFLNVLLNDKDNLFIGFIAFVAVLAGLQYYEIFDVTQVTNVLFHGFYATTYLFIIPLVFLAILWITAFRYFRKNLYLDTGLKGKHTEARTEDYTWLNQFGTLGTFLKNDIKLLKRNKRSKTTLLMSFLFLFYGLIFMVGALDGYENPMWKMFAGIFVSGGFLFTFGQFVPSWDSAYYPLMMSQNIQYKEYIASKWWLVVIGTLISTVLAAFYLYFGIETYLIILVGAVYNIGVNSHMVLLGGAYIKTPIDLASSKQAFGDKKAFNLKTFLLSIPKLLLPVVLYALGYYLISPVAGYAFVAVAGILGFAFRNKVFSMIEKVYKIEKYKTIAAYKQKN